MSTLKHNTKYDAMLSRFTIRANGINFRFDNRQEFEDALTLFKNCGLNITSHSNTDSTNMDMLSEIKDTRPVDSDNKRLLLFVKSSIQMFGNVRLRELYDEFKGIHHSMFKNVNILCNKYGNETYLSDVLSFLSRK